MKSHRNIIGMLKFDCFGKVIHNDILSEFLLFCVRNVGLPDQCNLFTRRQPNAYRWGAETTISPNLIAALDRQKRD